MPGSGLRGGLHGFPPLDDQTSPLRFAQSTGGDEGGVLAQAVTGDGHDGHVGQSGGPRRIEDDERQGERSQL